MHEAARYTAAIAREILGRADRGFSDGKHLRYDHISVNLQKGTYYDASADVGGDMLELVRSLKKLQNGEAEALIARIREAEDGRIRAHMDPNRPLPEDVVPTFSHETERAIAGGLILHPDCFGDVGEVLEPGDMTFWVHQTIFDQVGEATGKERTLQIGALVQACGGDDGGDIVPGFTLTEYIARIAADCPDDFEHKARDLALHLRDVTREREKSDEDFERQGSLEDARDAAKFKLRAFDDVKLQIQANYLVRGILPRSGLIVVWGPPKCGKSFWTYDLAMHVALGAEYRGRKTEQGAVVYFMLEGEYGYGARVQAYRDEYLKDHQGVIPLYDITARTDLVGDHKTIIKDIAAQLGDVSPALVVIDTLNRSMRGSESDDEDMTAFVKAADAIREAFACAVVIIHHCGVGGERPRGHTSLTGAADAQIAVRRDDNRDVVVKIEYMKDGEEGVQFLSRLRSVEVGREVDGQPITSCVIEPLDGKVGDREYKASPQEKDLMECILTAIAEHGVAPSAAGLQLPQSIVKVVEWKYAKTLMYERTITGQDDPKKHEDRVNQAVSRCGKKLQDGNVIAVHQPSGRGGWVWWTNRPVAGMPSTSAKKMYATPADQPPLSEEF